MNDNECEIALLPHQLEFVNDTKTEYLGLCAGMGAGKTYAFVTKAISLAMDNIGFSIALLEPTNSLVGLILVPKLEEVLDELEIEYTTRTRPVLTYTLYFEDGETDLLLMSAENYSRHIGYEVAAFGVDEVDTISKTVATQMFIKLAGRKRGMAPVKQGFFVSTPEGFNWVHDFFIREPQKAKAEGSRRCDNRKLIHASTYDNPFLDDDYIPGLLRIYPQNLIEAYLEGKFVNLESNTVYDMFDRTLNDTDKTLEDFPKAPIHIGMDFNIGKMSAIIHVMTRTAVLCVDEILGEKNTNSLMAEIKRRYPDNPIYIYPDCAGANGSTNASKSDIALLQAVFGSKNIKYHPAHPAVKDRVACVNALLCNGEGKRRYLVNQFTCPGTVDALEQQVYNKSGTPDKDHDKDHPLDALGYFVEYNYPIQRKKGSIRTR